MYLRAAAACFLGFVSVLHAEQPFAFTTTPGKLPKEVVPRHYAIRINPNPEAATFTGEVRIDVEASKAVSTVVLNSLGLRIQRAAIDGNAVSAELNEAAQLLTLSGLKITPGKHSVELAFTGTLNERPEGLYLTKYQLPDGTQRKALVTQMEPTDARRMFPCWDEPVFRATFQLTAVVPKGETALSNMPIEKETALPDGRREVAFGITPSMSSYLVAYASAELESIEDQVGDTRLRILATPGKKAQMRYAMESTKKILPYFNDYFGVAYPLPKLDQVSFPSVAASGMENWGCIIYADTALLFDEKTSSQSTRERVFEIVAHEIAHQWFGDLVTMAWWDNLWLNEGFASWMASKASDHFNPTWKKWLRAAGSKEVAMRLDARSTTHPIQQPILSEADAMRAFDEITYQKGQAFLRMLESWLGEDTFRAGMRRYFAVHRFQNTTTADLWAAFEQTSGKQVKAMAAGWTEQPGFPVLRVENGEVTQKRFSIHYPNAAPLAWKIPVAWQSLPAGKIEKGLVETQALKLGGETEAVALLPAGYYRAHYAGTAWERVKAHLSGLDEASRLAVAQDTWALAQAQTVPLSRWLEVAKILRDDPSPTIGGHLLEVLGTIDHLARGDQRRTDFQKWAREFLAPRFQTIGWDGKPGEEPATASHRSALISLLGRLGDADVLAGAKSRAATFLTEPESLPPDLREAVLFLAGRSADVPLWEKFHALAKQSPSTEQKHLLYGALVAAQDPGLTLRTLALSLTGELPAKIATRLVTRVASEGEKPEVAWTFAKSRLPELLSLMSANSADEYLAWLFRSFSDTERAKELEEFTKQNLPPSAEKPTAIAADEIRFKAEFKKRVLDELTTWLQTKA